MDGKQVGPEATDRPTDGDARNTDQGQNGLKNKIKKHLEIPSRSLNLLFRVLPPPDKVIQMRSLAHSA